MTMLSLGWGCFFLPAFLGTGMIPFCAHGAAWHQTVRSCNSARASRRVTLMDSQMSGEGVKNERREGGNVHKFWLDATSTQRAGPVTWNSWSFSRDQMDGDKRILSISQVCMLVYIHMDRAWARGTHRYEVMNGVFRHVGVKGGGQVSRRLLEVLVPEFNHCFNIVLSFGDLLPNNDNDIN